MKFEASYTEVAHVFRIRHLLGKYLYEEYRREIEPIARRLQNEGYGIDSIVEALREQGITVAITSSRAFYAKTKLGKKKAAVSPGGSCYIRLVAQPPSFH